MKYLLLLLFTLLLHQSLYANIDERKIDVYFANGIDTEKKDSEKNALLLENEIKVAYYSENREIFNQQIGEVYTAYNETHSFLTDSIETLLQKLSMQGLFDWLFKTSHETDLKEQVKAYKESILSGHKVLVVAHSQGNLYTYEAHKGVDDWMQKYFQVVSIASPQMTSVKDGTPLISWDNDLVAYLGIFNSSLVENEVRKVSWESYDDQSDTEKPKHNYVYKSQVGDVYKDSWIAVEGFTDKFDTNVHAFTFYMGQELKEGDKDKVNYNEVYKNPFDEKTLQTNKAKAEIMRAIKDQLILLDKTSSQWKLQNENTETTVCEKRRSELVHFENAVSSIPVAYPFNEDGKVYQVPDANGSASYVIGSADGTQILDVQNGTDSRCYELENTPDVISIENTCGDLNATSGVITVDLIWGNKDLDLDLSIDFTTDGTTYDPALGEFINKDEVCPREYFFIKDESSVKVGTYKIKVGVKGNVDSSMVPESVSVLIKAKGETKTLNIPVEDTRAFDMGYVAEIEVTEDKQTSTRVSKTTSSGTQIISGTSTTSTSTNTVYPDYIYEIIRLISQLYYGPVRDAYLEFYSVSDYAKGLSPLFIGATSGGYDLHTAGLVFIPFSVVDQLSDNELYLLSAQGGEDIDADDDGQIDAMPTSNKGTLHGVLSGKMIKDGAYKVNILTELAYQVTKDMFDVNTSEVILERMDKVAQRLISKDINGDKVINSNDMTKWLPTTDKDKLLFDYNTTIEPMVQKLFKGEDIFTDAYKLLYYPVAEAGEHKTVGTTPPFILDGSKSYDINGNIVEYLWMEGYTILCQSSEPVCEIDMLDIGTHNINLKVTDNDGETRDDNTTIRVSLYAPVAKAGADQEIFENGTTFTLDGSNSYDSNGEIIEYIWSSGDTIYCQGTDPICVVENLSVADYSFTLKVTDDENNTAVDRMNIIYPYKPVAVADDDINITYGTTVTLDGSNSYDSDGYIVEYKWSEEDIIYCIGDTPTCTIDNLDAGDHVLKLQVKDDKGTVGVDSVNVKLKVEAKAILVGSYDTSAYAYDGVLSKDGNTAYIADGEGGLKIIDISNPSIPLLIGSYITSDAYGISLSLDENTVYIADIDNGLYIIDISNLSVPRLIGSYSIAGFAYGITASLDNNTVYIADGIGLKIIDISNPTKPAIIGSYDTNGTSWNVTLSVDNNTVYIADGIGFKIIDVSNNAKPMLVGSYDSDGYCYDIAVSKDGNTVYMADRGGGLKIVDISNPTIPILIGSYKMYSSNSILLSSDGTKAYLSDSSNGLYIIDISNPTIPTLIGNYYIRSPNQSITLSSDGNIACIINRFSGLQIFDISSYSQ